MTKELLESDFGTNIDLMLADIKDTNDYTLTAPPDYDHVWLWVDDKWVELLPINNPNIPYDDKSIWDSELNQWVECPELSAYKHLEQQELMWERIKERRLQAVTSGVYVESVDKTFHTDEVSVTTYSTIAGMIALDNYEPVEWKTMDNTWLLLTETLFKELQNVISIKTSTNYAIAERHKAAMLKVDNPLEYDYSEGWV